MMTSGSPKSSNARSPSSTGAPPVTGAVYTGFEKIDRGTGKVLAVVRPSKRGHILHELRLNCVGTASTVALRRRCIRRGRALRRDDRFRRRVRHVDPYRALVRLRLSRRAPRSLQRSWRPAVDELRRDDSGTRAADREACRLSFPPPRATCGSGSSRWERSTATVETRGRDAPPSAGPSVSILCSPSSTSTWHSRCWARSSFGRSWGRRHDSPRSGPGFTRRSTRRGRHEHRASPSSAVVTGVRTSFETSTSWGRWPSCATRPSRRATASPRSLPEWTCAATSNRPSSETTSTPWSSRRRPRHTSLSPCGLSPPAKTSSSRSRWPCAYRQAEELVERRARRAQARAHGRPHPRVPPGRPQLKELVDRASWATSTTSTRTALNLGKVRQEENILWSFAPHDISVILLLVGALPDSATCSGQHYLQHEPRRRDDDLPAVLAGKPRAHIFVSWLHPSRSRSSWWSATGRWRSSTTPEEEIRQAGPLRPARGPQQPAARPPEGGASDDRDRCGRAAAAGMRALPGFRPDAPAPLVRCNERDRRSASSSGLPGFARSSTGVPSCWGTCRARGFAGAKRRASCRPSRIRNPCAFGIPNTEKGHEMSYVRPSHSDRRSARPHRRWDEDLALRTRVRGRPASDRRCSFGQNTMVSAGVVIGDNVKVQNNVAIYTGTTIEDDVFLGPVLRSDQRHQPALAGRPSQPLRDDPDPAGSDGRRERDDRLRHHPRAVLFHLGRGGRHARTFRTTHSWWGCRPARTAG